MITFDEIIAASQSGPTPLEWVPEGCLKMVSHHHPFSIKPIEFQTIYEYITSRGLRWGFEIGTGLGISALAAGFAMHRTGGRMVTLDSYIEEHHNDCMAYTDLTDVYDQSADAYRGLQHLRKEFGIEKALLQAIGRSPESVRSVVEAHFGDNKLDYVMIDAEHTDAAMIRDLEAVRPLLAENHAIFLHDTNCFNPNIIAGAYWFPQCRIPDGWNLSVIENFGSRSREPLRRTAANVISSRLKRGWDFSRSLLRRSAVL
jgi:predicted O-methyltransferase YrrM